MLAQRADQLRPGEVAGEIEQVCAMRQSPSDGMDEYRVSFKGFSSQFNLWLSRAQLRKHEHLILAYEKQAVRLHYHSGNL